MDKASANYEQMMFRALTEANRVLKSSGELVVVYAHKTTLGWATLVDALRRAGFTVDGSLASRHGNCRPPAGSWIPPPSLPASSLSPANATARRRATMKNKSAPILEEIVRERVETLWDMGISGADLVIASVGAGLRAFTRFARVEYANGEEVPAERFLTEVETVVLETILARLSKEVGGKGGRHESGRDLDPASASTSCGATPTARRNWTRARPSSSPTARTSNWTASTG